VKRLRVSFIEFLNALPLGWGFLHGRQKGIFDLLFDVPSECSRHLSTGEADVGLIPVVEYQRIPGLKVIPGISISTQQEARSVLFVSKIPIQEVKSVSLDIASRTSAALVKILMSEFYQRPEVRYLESTPDIGLMLDQSDAALVIGNPALKISFKQIPFVYDLAAEWYQFTALPFVFAFWAVNEECEMRDEIQNFEESKEEGLANLELIAKQYSSRLRIPESEILHYLSKNLDYSLGQQNRKGLNLFFQLAKKYELIPESRPVDYLDCGK
jgi:chorismate dehydratase